MGSAGRTQSEEEMLAEAIRLSQAQEESRERQSLREQQDAELLESMMMDNMREQEQQRIRAEEEEMQRVAEQSRLEDEQKQREQEQRAAADLEMKRARLTTEPPAGESVDSYSCCDCQMGRGCSVLSTSEAINTIYDFVDIQQLEELAGQQYRLVSTMPRKAYEDREQTLADAGIQNQFVLVVEVL